MSARARTAAVLTLIASLAIAIALTGCGLTSGGDKGTVEQAFLDFSANTKTARFVGSVSATDPAKGKDAVAVQFDMAMDGSDPTRPAFSMKMSAANSPGDVEIVVIGDDLYMTTEGKSQKLDVSGLNERMKSFSYKDQFEMLKALSESVGNYQRGGTDTVDGTPVDVYTGELDVGKLVDGLIPQLEKMFPSGAPGGFGGGEGGTEMLSGLIKSMVKEPVRMWFGIDGEGVLRLIAFELKMSMPFAPEGKKAEPIAIEARFEARDINEPVEIVAPKDAEPVGDFADLQKLMK